MRRLTVGPWLSGCATAAVLLAGGPASVANGVAPADAASSPVQPIGMTQLLEVSHDGRFVLGYDQDSRVLLDRATGVKTPTTIAGFVRDNPNLRLTSDESGWWLSNAGTGSRWRIDTMSDGSPMQPAWTSVCDDDCFWNDTPTIELSSSSISKDGRWVAFCANYLDAARPEVYLKDLRTGALRRQALVCGVNGQEDALFAPEVSETGSVVYVRGNARASEDTDSLYLEHTGGSLLRGSGESRIRRISGWGSMTRDGSRVFVSYGDKSGRVGVYNNTTRTTKRLPGRNQIQGSMVYQFDALDQSTRRGRFVVGWSTFEVWDRENELRTDVTPLLSQHSLNPCPYGSWAMISGDGGTVFVQADDPATDGISCESVAVRGWQPVPEVAVKSVSGASKLFVDVNPNKGTGFWTFKVQYLKEDGTTWATLRNYKTRTGRETRTLDFRKGTYRVVVKAKYGYQGTTSSPALLEK